MPIVRAVTQDSKGAVSMSATASQSMMECPACKTQMSVTVSAPRLMNLSRCCILVIEHEGQRYCPGCNRVFVAAVAGLQGVALKLVEVPPQQQERVLLG